MMLARALGAAAILGFMAHPALAQAIPEQDQEFAQKAAEGGPWKSSLVSWHSNRRRTSKW
jgi:hypothetical protein